MQIIWFGLTFGIVGACVWSLIGRFTGQKSCCGTMKQPRMKRKHLSAPIGNLTVKISGMRCENCRRSVTDALNSLDGVAAKVCLEDGMARVSFERNISDEEIVQAVENAGFDVMEICR